MVSEPGLSYVGRFAPSPSGPLHFGSLVCALASFLDARANRGRWLVRMEDIDPPRELPGAAEAILASLQAHGLEWDGEVLWQSSRQEAYRRTLDRLIDQELVYPCGCSRKRLRKHGGIYDGYCRRQPPATDVKTALRLKVRDLPQQFRHESADIRFDDLVQGPQRESVAEQGDFIIHRKDGLFAYQLAVVVDDVAQGITRVVRGSDLLDVTARQIYLFHLLGAAPPAYAHIPVVVDNQQRKLSKQNHAEPIDSGRAAGNLWHACAALGHRPPAPPDAWTVQSLLQWALAHWHLERVPRQLSVPQ